MDEFLNQTISDEEIARMRDEFTKRLGEDSSSLATFRNQFAYALVRSMHEADIKNGIDMLELDYESGDDVIRRDCLFYLAFANTRLGRYQRALKCLDSFLQFEPENMQAQNLRKHIKDKITKDGVTGLLITGGAALAIGGLIKLGIELAKR